MYCLTSNLTQRHTCLISGKDLYSYREGWEVSIISFLSLLTNSVSFSRSFLRFKYCWSLSVAVPVLVAGAMSASLRFHPYLFWNNWDPPLDSLKVSREFRTEFTRRPRFGLDLSSIPSFIKRSSTWIFWLSSNQVINFLIRFSIKTLFWVSSFRFVLTSFNLNSKVSTSSFVLSIKVKIVLTEIWGYLR